MALVTRARVLVAATLVLTGCSALIGVNDIFLDDNSGEGGEGGLGEAGFGDEGHTGSEGGPFTDGGDCNADVQADPVNCGRCGHSCLGGGCTTGTCQPVVVMDGLNGPRDIAFDDTFVYCTSYDDGTIKKIKKADLDSGIETIISKWYEMEYVGVSGGKMFWMGEDFHGDGGVPDAADPNAAFGGAWSCTLPACTDKKMIAPTDVGRALLVKDPYVYDVNQDDMRRVKVDGTGPQQILNSTEGIYDVSVDDGGIYFLTFGGVQRIAADGGGTETTVGGGVTDFVAKMALDDKNIYWSYYDQQSGGYKGYAVSTNKASPGAKIFYGDMNVSTLAVAGDDTNVYWVNAGTDQSSQNGSFNMCPIAGCTAGVSSVVLGNLSFPNMVRVDTDAIYFTEFGSGGPSGRLYRLAKP